MPSIRRYGGMTPSQCLAARTLLGWTPADLAQAAGVSSITVRQFEAGKIEGERRALTMMQRALEGAGIQFAKDGTDDGVRLGTRST
jgi:transcriptional regulator with XRE-family HTH domain